jgi:hypothetical protein
LEWPMVQIMGANGGAAFFMSPAQS